MSGLMRGDTKCGDRRCVVNVRRKTKSFTGRIIVVAEKIVRLDHLNIGDLGRLQNLARAFRAGDIRTGPRLTLLRKAPVTRNCAQMPRIKGTPM